MVIPWATNLLHFHLNKLFQNGAKFGIILFGNLFGYFSKNWVILSKSSGHPGSLKYEGLDCECWYLASKGASRSQDPSGFKSFRSRSNTRLNTFGWSGSERRIWKSVEEIGVSSYFLKMSSIYLIL